MKENLVTIKAAIVAGCTALGAFLGWKGVMVGVWIRGYVNRFNCD